MTSKTGRAETLKKAREEEKRILSLVSNLMPRSFATQTEAQQHALSVKRQEEEEEGKTPLFFWFFFLILVGAREEASVLTAKIEVFPSSSASPPRIDCPAFLPSLGLHHHPGYETTQGHHSTDVSDKEEEGREIQAKEEGKKSKSRGRNANTEGQIIHRERARKREKRLSTFEQEEEEEETAGGLPHLGCVGRSSVWGICGDFSLTCGTDSLDD